MAAQQKPGVAGGPLPGLQKFSHANYTADPFREFRDAMAAGIVTSSELLPDGRLHRIHIEGHRRGTTNGAYVLHMDGKPAGWFQDFKSGVSGTWTADGGRWRLDEATRKQIEADRAARTKSREFDHAKKAEEARRLWGRAKPCDSHPYLVRKGVQAHGLRVGDWPKWTEGPDGWRRITLPGALLIPMVDEAGTLWNVQAIFPETHPELGRDKDFMGGRKAGLFFPIGEPSDTLRITEGYATAAMVHEATGDKTFVAFDAGNLAAVALTVRKHHPGQRLILMADDDRHTPGNPGVTKARKAALAVRGLVSIPPWPEGHPGGDWNDFVAYRREADHGR